MITRGRGSARIGETTCDVQSEDVLHIPTGWEHEIRNTGEELLGVLFINVPTGDGLIELRAAQQAREES